MEEFRNMSSRAKCAASRKLVPNRGRDGFTKRYHLHKLVWYEEFSNPPDAIVGEKKIKGWSRWKKVQLIQQKNPTWKDLSLEWDSSTEVSEGQY